MRKMRAVQVGGPGGALELVEREVPAPGAGLSGICTATEGSNGEAGPSGAPSMSGAGGGGAGASATSRRPTAATARAATTAP